MDLKSYLGQRLDLVDLALEQYLPSADTLPVSLHEAMRYSVFAGGKRIRPILMIAACEAVGGRVEQVLPAACAIEMIHTYSLIHDDLPAMDNDDFRRGRPTNHKVYGEATAILAGDALLTEAFILLSSPAMFPDCSSDVVPKVVNLLSRAAGSQGMVGGQVVDMESEGKKINFPTLEYIHTHKTGALLLAAVQCGGLIGGADEAEYRHLSRYGEASGLAFQVADDILDIVGDQQQLGKDIGSDQVRGKATYPALLGLDEARQKAIELRNVALEALLPLGQAATPLAEIARYIVDRSS
jgi:geranylgeranyl diphosphate synthase, type II